MLLRQTTRHALLSPLWITPPRPPVLPRMVGARLKSTSSDPFEGMHRSPGGRKNHTLSTVLGNPNASDTRVRAAQIGQKASSVLAKARGHAYSHRRALWTAAGVVGLLGTVYFLNGDDGANDPVLGRPNPADVDVLSRVPTSKLISGWIVYAFYSSPTLMAWSEPVYRALRHVPVVSYLIDDFARRTFFRQFFGYETASEAEKRVWTPLRSENVGIMTAYNVETHLSGVFNTPETIRDTVAGTLQAIEAVGTFGKNESTPADILAGDTRCWVHTRASGLLPDPMVMKRASEYLVSRRWGGVHFPGVPEDGDFARLMTPEEGTDFERLLKGDRLSQRDRKSLHELYGYLRQFMLAGQKHGVRVIVDAEQSWFQPVVDVMTEQLMREFNTGKDGPPVVCATFQAYLRRNADLVRSQMERAKEGGYKLIFSQVRGAHLAAEHAWWLEQGFVGPPPVWGSKAETHDAYDTAMCAAFEAIKAREVDPNTPDVAVIFATNSEETVDNAMKYLDDMGLGVRQSDGTLLLDETTANGVAFAQSYGRKDNVTNRIAGSVKSESGLPLVCKSAAYGTLEHALPALSRQAGQYKVSSAGGNGAITERKRLGRELCRRYIPFYKSDR